MRSRSRFKSLFFLVVIPLLAVVGGVAYIAWRQSVRGVQVIASPPPLIGQKTPINIGLQAARGNVAQAEVRLLQGGKTTVVATYAGTPSPRVEIPATVDASAIGAREGEAVIEVWARDDFWRPLRVGERAAQFPVTVDLTPPRIEILGATQYISPGGAGLIAFRAGDAARADVRIGNQSFPTFPYGPADKRARVALIALPHDFGGNAPLTVSAVDAAGNSAARTVPAELKPRRFPHDTIEIRDSLLEAKVPELLPQRPPTQPLLEAFLIINRVQRRQAEEEKRTIGAKTAAEPLWTGVFVQPRNTKVFANFAESRTYTYQGKLIDMQVHFGYDLAATKHMAVPAANTGVVVFTGPLTIYGNTIVIDHGLGLQTLYAHLSSIDVKPGDKVEKGQPIGRSGTTGLAIGDHLHYEVLVHGISVTPLEWWDTKWLRDRIAKPLKDAGLPSLGGIDAPTEEDKRTSAAPRRRAR